MGVPPRLDSAMLVKGNHMFNVLAAKSVQNGPFSGAAAEKYIASEARNAAVPGGPGASTTVCFQMFLKDKQHPGSARRKMSKSCVGPKVPKWPLARERNTFSKTVSYDFASRVGSPKKSLFGLLVRARSYSVLWTNHHFFPSSCTQHKSI